MGSTNYKPNHNHNHNNNNKRKKKIIFPLSLNFSKLNFW